MRAKAYPLLEQTIEDGVRFYLLNRVNKWSKRVMWVEQKGVDGPAVPFTDDDYIESHVRMIANEAAEHIMTCVSEAFVFTDDEAVVPQEEPQEPPTTQGSLTSSREWQQVGAYDQGRTDGENRIIAFLERELAACTRAVGECVDEGDWASASMNSDWMARLTHLVSRIKADDIGEKE